MAGVDSFVDFISSYHYDVQQTAAAARELIKEMLPEAIEQVDATSKIIVYGGSRTYSGLVCAIAPQKTYVNLMFSRGAELPDPEKLLEGTGKRARHVKLKTAADAGNPAVRNLIREADRTHPAK